uniref:Uncharacterized protein n=1 Tax=Trieres chinensis TaxID=1514140 RepID=A0A7S1YVK5_TRICV|mmetsp:Transcript_114/g.275  ORF Transcript_114/g.275 Transcript_114/m.275 type:complete len:116 (+) Transcript_114:54-401(+)
MADEEMTTGQIAAAAPEDVSDKKKKKKKKGKKDADASEADVAGEEEEEKAEGDTKEEDNSTNSLGQEGGTVATALSVTSWLMLEVAGFLFSILKALLIWLIGTLFGTSKKKRGRS